MVLDELKKISKKNNGNKLVNVTSLLGGKVKTYPKSINSIDQEIYFIGKTGNEKHLYIASTDPNSNLQKKFVGKILDDLSEDVFVIQCSLLHKNAKTIQEIFPFTKPILLGVQNSFGFGDRIGLANHAHIRSLEGSDFKPIIAQQSIRELNRTKRTAEEVMDAAIWAVFQEGYKTGYGSDADHLKTNEDIDLMISAGFTMFTFDPGEHVINEADSINLLELENKVNDLNWLALEDSLTEMVNRYTSKKNEISKDFSLSPNYEEVLRAILKYGNAVAHIKSLYDHLSLNYSNLPYEVEISVDETESVTSPFEHFFIASELNRLDVEIVSLAPRFVGDFEKGIDYVGDLEIFKEEYLKHVQISEYFGSYKISLHSGSDKFGVYKTIGQLNRGFTHVKTAGTSYLEALKVVALTEPDIFRKILDFARVEFDKEKESYHVSADLNKVLSSENYSNEELVDQFQQNDFRQVLHVTFGKVLTTIDNNGKHLFKDDIYSCLIENEEIHYGYLIKHFKNHLDPFK